MNIKKIKNKKQDEKKVAKAPVGAGKKGKDIVSTTNPLEIERNDL